MLRKYAIAVFVAVHILIGIVAAFFVGDEPNFFSHVSLLLSSAKQV